MFQCVQVFSTQENGAVAIDPNFCVTDTEPPRVLSMKSVAATMVERSLFLNGRLTVSMTDLTKVILLGLDCVLMQGSGIVSLLKESLSKCMDEGFVLESTLRGWLR